MDFKIIIKNNLYDLKTIFNNDYENNNCKEPEYLEIKHDIKQKKKISKKKLMDLSGILTLVYIRITFQKL